MSGCCDNDVIQGAQGPDGKSAYQIWLDEGNVGTEQDFLDSLVGATGSQGPIGLTGPAGATGATGATGPTGADGDDGASYLTGTGNPNASLGNDGDTYSNNANGQIWKKSAGVWAFTGYTLLGPQGIQGPIGLTGATGAAGTNGTNGTNGTDGLGYDNTTSSTSITLGSLGATTSMTWTTNKAFIAGSRVRVADSSNPSANFFEGVVNTYNQFTGAVDLVDIGVATGSGTISAWNVSITGEQGGASSTPAWSAVLATGNTSGAYDPTIDTGQKLGLNGGTANALEYNTYVSGVPQLKGASGAAITDGVGTSVEVDNTNATIDTPTTGALILPISNNPTVDVTTPIDGMIKYRSQIGNEDLEAYINGAWVSLTSGGAGSDTNGIGNWIYNSTTTAPPGSSELRFDNATVSSATNLYVHDTDNDSVDKGSILNIMSANDYFILVQTNNPANYALVQFSSVTDNGTYVTYGISSITVVGTFTTTNTFNILPLKASGGGGGTQDLTTTLGYGNTTSGEDIEVSSGDKIYLAALRSLGNTGTSITIDLSSGSDAMSMTVTDNFTLDFSNLRIGSGFINTTIGGSGGYVMTSGSNIELKDGGYPQTVSTVLGTKDRIHWVCDGSKVEINISKDLQ